MRFYTYINFLSKDNLPILFKMPSNVIHKRNYKAVIVNTLRIIFLLNDFSQTDLFSYA